VRAPDGGSCWRVPTTTGSWTSARQRHSGCSRRDIALAALDFALEELALRIGRAASSPSAAVFHGRFSSIPLPHHPYYTILGRTERLGNQAAVHTRQTGLETRWTSHGPFFKKDPDRLVQPSAPGRGAAGPFAAAAAARSNTTLRGAHAVGHPNGADPGQLARQPQFVASTLIGYTSWSVYPAMRWFSVAHRNASWMQEVLGKMEALDIRVPITLLPPFSGHTEPKRCGSTARSLLGFYAENG